MSKFSLSAINRVIEKNKDNVSFKKPIPVLSDARKKSDEELQGFLAKYGIVVDKSTFRTITTGHFSAHSLSEKWIESCGKFEKEDEDWFWLAAVVLWERWAPDISNYEMLDDTIDEGHDFYYTGNKLQAIQCWEKSFNHLSALAKIMNVKSIEDFEEKNDDFLDIEGWLSDYEWSLLNVSEQDITYLEKRLNLAEILIKMFSEEVKAIVYWRCIYAESLFKMGKSEEAEKLFEILTSDNQKNAWNWIIWSDCYVKIKEFEKSERLLSQAVGACEKEHQDYSEILERLVDLYMEWEQPEKLAKANEQLLEWREQYELDDEEYEDDFNFDDEYASDGFDIYNPKPKIKNELEKIGRNDPCPCGSGMKFKKCCG